MSFTTRRTFGLVVIALATSLSSLNAHDITITGTTTFSALDGSADDHDGVADGTFTVNDGDLTIAGSITCNDDTPLAASASACPMRFVVSGSFTMQGGSSLLAENRRGSGNGGRITVEAGGDIVLAGTAGAVPGALVSSSRTSTTSPNGNTGGTITFDAGGNVDLGPGSVVAANALNATSGRVNIHAEDDVVVAGLITSGPTSEVLSTALTGRVLLGDNSNQKGGPISISSACQSEPAITVLGTAAIVSQGETPGAGAIDLSGCGIEVRGLIASISRAVTSTVKLRSGGDLLVDGRDLSNPGAPTARFGRVRADATHNGTVHSRVLLLADGDVQVLGPASGVFVVTSDPGQQSDSKGGSITGRALNGGINASGLAFRAGINRTKNKGGLIDLAAAGEINLNSATLAAVGGHSDGTGGAIKVRSHAAGVSWTSGVGDVRPTGTDVPAARRGTIRIFACTTIDLSGTQFPTIGGAVLGFPNETTGKCSPAQPSLPDGETLPACADAAPAVSTTSPANGATGVAANTNITVTFTEAVNLTDTTAFTLECPVGSAQAFTLAPPPPGGVTSYTLDPSSNLPAGVVCTVSVIASRVTDVDANDPPDNMAADYLFSFTVGDTPPTAVDDTATVAEDSGPTAIDVLANDSNPDGGPITIQSVVQPSNGNVVITGGGTGLTYQPNANYCNTPSGPADTFTYTLNGGSTATVSVTVTCVSDAGTAVDDTATVLEDSGPNAIDVLANDTPPDTGTNTIQSVTQPANGTVVITGGGTGLTYQPNANYCNAPPGTSPDVFTYTINGGSVGDVSVTVTCVDDNPTAVNDSATVAEDSGPTAVDVLANDTNPDGGPMSIASVTQPANGAVVITGGGTGLTYQPNPNYCNTPPGTTPDTFTYTLSPGGSVATVSVSVTCVDDPPVAVNDSATVNEDSGANAIDVLANDTDADGGPRSVGSVTQPANGAVVITGGGTGVTYQPNPNYCNAPPGTSPDTFTYTLTPGGSVGTVSVTVMCINDPPVAQPKLYSAQANMKIIGLGGLLTGVTDADSGINGCAPTFSVNGVGATSPAGGIVSNVNPADGTFDFEPPPGVTGNVTFTYTVQDNGCPGTATSAPATATVAVAGPVIWFVDSTAPAGGNGTWTGTNAKAFQTLAQAAAVDATDHRIFVINNSGTSITYAGGIALNTGEWLVGQGATGASFDALMVITPPLGTVPRPSINGVRPTFSGTVVVNTRSASNVVRVAGFNLATGTAAALTNAGTTLNAVTIDVGSVTTTTGTAVSITGTGNGSTTANSMRFISVSSSGAANGIDLRNAVGTFEVTGDGTNTSLGGNGSGGTIANAAGGDGLTTGNGVYLENVQNVTLRRMTINGTNQNHGIRGVLVNGFTLEFSTVSGTNGTNAALDEGSVNFDNLTGSAAITSSVIEGGFEDNLNVVNTTGTLNRLTVTGSTFGFNNTVNGNNNILIEALNAGTVLNFTLQSSLIRGARADWINAASNGGASMNAIIGGSTGALGNTFDNLTTNAHPGSAPGGNRVVLGANGTMTVDIRNNTLRGARGEAIRVRGTGIAGGVTGNVSGHVRNNTIGVQATANSGSSEGSGIFIFGDGGSDMTMAVSSNQVFQYNNHGILLQFGDELNDGSVYNVTVTGNTVSNPGTINTDFNAIHLNNGTVAATDNFTSCADIGGAGVGNSVAGGGSGTIPPNNTDIRLRQRQSTTVRLPGYAGANNNDAAVVAYLASRNTLTTAAASNTVPTGGGFIGGAACLVP